MANPFFPFENIDEDASALGVGLLATAPLAGAVAIASQRMQRDVPLGLPHITGHQNHLASLGRKVGENLKANVSMDKAAQEVMDSDGVENLLKKVSNRRALIQTLLTTIDDPSAGFDVNQVQSIKDTLLKIAEIDDSQPLSDDLKNIVKKAMDTVSTSASEQAKRKMNNRLNEFLKVGKELRPATHAFKPTSVLTQVTTSQLSTVGEAKKLFKLSGKNDTRPQQLVNRINKLKNIIGNNADSFLDIVHADVGGGQKGVYARIYSNNGPNRRYLTTIPLMTNTENLRRGPKIVRMGENLQTGYYAPSRMTRARDALNVIRSKGTTGSVGLSDFKLIGPEDFFIENLASNIDRSSSGSLTIRGRDAYNASIREIMEVSSRVIADTPVARDMSQRNLGFVNHSLEMGRIRHQNLVFVGMESLKAEEKDELLTGAISSRNVQGGRLDPGVGADRLLSNVIDGRQYAMLSIRDESTIGSFFPGSAPTRLTTPVVSRLEQVQGRAARFIRGNSRKHKKTLGGINRNVELGATDTSIVWKDGLSGGTVKGTLLDVTMGKGPGNLARTEGYGQFWYAKTKGGFGFVQNDFTIPLLDPKSHQFLSTRLTERLLENAEAEKAEYFTWVGNKLVSNKKITKEKIAEKVKIVNTKFLKDWRKRFYNTKVTNKRLNRLNARALRKRNERLAKLRAKISGSEIFDPTLGVGPGGTREIHRDPRATGVWLGVTEAHEVNGKRQLHLTGIQERRLDRAKIFGTQGKGTVVPTERNLALRDLRQYGVTEDWLTRVGLESDFIYGSGDMLKKAPDYLQGQVLSGLHLTQREQSKNFIAEATQEIATRSGALAPDMNYKNLHAAASYAIDTLGKGLASGEVRVEDAGRVLAGIYYGFGMQHGVNLDKDGFMKGSQANRTLLMNQMRSSFGTNFDAVENIMRQGLALGYDNFSVGTGHGDYKLGRGSVEPRFMEFIASRLSDMGRSEIEISGFIADILKRKIGLRENIALIDPFTKMMSSALGRSLTSTNVPVLSIDDMFREIATHGSFSEYLKTQQEGVRVDLGTKGDAVSYAAKQAFGNQTELYFPGGNAMDYMSGTEIRQAGGENLEIGAHYARKVDEFSENLMTLTSSQTKAEKDSEAIMKEFRRDVAQMIADPLIQLSAGKIKGSNMSVLQGYSRSGVGMSEAQLKVMNSLMQSSQGTAIFYDHLGFMSALGDFVGGSGGVNKADAAQMLDIFLTGSERALAQAKAGKAVKDIKGIPSLVSRNPILGYGNINIGMIYRELSEAGQGEQDDLWKRIMSVKKNREALRELGLVLNTDKAISGAPGRRGLRLGVSLNSFSDIAEIGDEYRGARRQFFETLVSTMDEWSGKGGGSITVPDARFNLHYNGKVISGADFAFAGAAIGDFDGDWANVLLLNKNQRAALLSTMKDDAAMERYHKFNATQIIQGEVYKDAAKDALVKRAKAQGANPDEILEELHQMRQDLLKEKGMKKSTGPVDVSLNNLRRAIGSLGAEGKELSNEAQVLLTMLEEHTTIKGKKLPTFIPWGDMMAQSIQESMDKGSIEPFKNLLESEILPRDQFGDLYRGTKVTVSPETGSALPKYVDSAREVSVGLDAVLEHLNRALINYKATGGSYATTANTLAANLASDDPLRAMGALNEVLLAGEAGMQSGMSFGLSGGYADVDRVFASMDTTWGRITAAGSKLDGRLMGAVGIGLMGSMAFFGATGIGGYSPKPLMVDNMPNAYINREVSSFNLLNQQEAYQEGQASLHDPYNLNDRSINMGATTVIPPSGYNVRGEVPSSSGLSELNGYINVLTKGYGRGSILVNDTRRPITPAYMDRLMGEY